MELLVILVPLFIISLFTLAVSNVVRFYKDDVRMMKEQQEQNDKYLADLESKLEDEHGI